MKSVFQGNWCFYLELGGEDHGRKSRGDESPRIGSGGTLIQVVPPDFCHVSKFQALAMDSSPLQISSQVYATGEDCIHIHEGAVLLISQRSLISYLYVMVSS
jgi:hypothetical protein